MDHSHWASRPRIFRAFSGIMCFQAFLQIIGIACVIGTVDTFKYIEIMAICLHKAFPALLPSIPRRLRRQSAAAGFSDPACRLLLLRSIMYSLLSRLSGTQAGRVSAPADWRASP